METGAAVEKQKQFFHSSLQNAYWRFAQFPQAWRSQQPRGGPNQVDKTTLHGKPVAKGDMVFIQP